MKSKVARMAKSAILLCVTSISLYSCSSFNFAELDEHYGLLENGNTVSKKQYDELAKKYEELLAKNKPTVQSNESRNIPQAVESSSNPAIITPLSKPAVTTLDPSDLVNQIDISVVDVKEEVVKSELKPRVENKIAPTSYNTKILSENSEIDGQISKLRSVQTLITENKFDQAMTLLKELENSKERQITVRAKMMVADLLFNQGEFDLASQVYEEVINHHAYSGFVIHALGKLVVCSEKLNQPEKQAKYYSMLHDFFEAA